MSVITIGIWEGKLLETTLYGPTVGQIVANSWLYWQPALLPGGLWQHFSSIPTFLLPQLLQCRLSEVNIEEVTLKLLSMSFHNKTCIRSAMESVIVGCGFRICLVKLGDQLNPTFTSGSG